MSAFPHSSAAQCAAVGTVYWLTTSLPCPLLAGKPPELHLGWVVLVIMAVAMFLKLGLHFYCVRLAGQSSSMVALAQVHLTSVFPMSIDARVLAYIVAQFLPYTPM